MGPRQTEGAARCGRCSLVKAGSVGGPTAHHLELDHTWKLKTSASRGPELSRFTSSACWVSMAVADFYII